VKDSAFQLGEFGSIEFSAVEKISYLIKISRGAKLPLY
jgi:hypothetical protein